MKQWPKKTIINYMTMRINYTQENPNVADTIPEKMEYVLNGLVDEGLIVPTGESYEYYEVGIVNGERIYKRVGELTVR